MWAYIFFAQKPRVADGAIDHIVAVPLHYELRQGGTLAQGYGGGTQKIDEMLVWVNLGMENLTIDTPLYEIGQRATLTLPDGEQKFASAESPTEVAKVRMLNHLQQVRGNLLPQEMTLAPSRSAAGLALFVFPINKKVWDTRREFFVTVSFQGQRSLALNDPHPAVSMMLPAIRH